MHFLFAILFSSLGRSPVIGLSDMVREVICEYEDAMITWSNIPTILMDKAVYKGNTLVVSWPQERGFNEGPSYKGRLSKIGESAIRLIKAGRSDSGTYKLIYKHPANNISEAFVDLQVIVPPNDSCIPYITHKGRTLQAELPQEGCGIPMLIPNWMNDTVNVLSGNVTVLDGRHQPGTYTVCAVGIALQCLKGNVDKLCSNSTLHALQPMNESSSVVLTVILGVIIPIPVIGIVICLVYFIRQKFASTGTNGKDEQTEEKTPLRDLSATELNSKDKDTPETTNQETILQEQLQIPQKLMHDTGSNHTGKDHKQMLDMVQKIVKRYVDLKKQTIDIYSKVKDFTEKFILVPDMVDIMNTRFPNFAFLLETKRKELENCSDEFEIVVVGEKSAGKSTFLNVLLGKDLLPMHSLGTTSCIRRLHNSLNTRLEFRTVNGSAKKITILKDLNHLKKTLTAQMNSVNQDDNSLAVIDIFWPIPWLQENVVLVDTPGIGEIDTLTKRIAERVSTAAGYIFIVDSNHAGGNQEGGIVKLLSADTTGSQLKDLSNFLFVLNKWDRVEQQKRGDIVRNTQDKLKTYFGALQDWQTVTFSAKMELEYQQCKANPKEAFDLLVRGLEQLMVKSIDRRLGENFQWIRQFGKVLHSTVDEIGQSLLMPEEDHKEKLTKSEECLVKARDQLRLKYEEVERLVPEKGVDLENKLRMYLQGSTGQSKLMDWSTPAPSGLKMVVDIPTLVQQRYKDVMFHWACVEPRSVIEASDQINTKCREIKEVISSNFDSVDIFNFNFLDEESIKFTNNFEGTGFFMIFLVSFYTAFSHFFGYISGDTLMKNATTNVMEYVLGEPLNAFISCLFTEPWKKQLSALEEDMQNKLNSSYKVLTLIDNSSKGNNNVSNKIDCLKKELTEALICLHDLEQNIQCTRQH